MKDMLAEIFDIRTKLKKKHLTVFCKKKSDLNLKKVISPPDTS